MHQPEGQPDPQGQKQRAPDVPRSRFQKQCAGHGDQSADGAHGNIDAAADHDDAHAQGHDEERRVQVEKVKEGLELPETDGEADQGNPVHEDKDNPGDDKQKRRIGHPCFWFAFV